jgi:hypothetical protein
MLDYLRKRRGADDSRPRLDPVLAGAKATVHPEQERALACALERGLITVMLVATLLCGGFLVFGKVVASIHRIAAALGAVH